MCLSDFEASMIQALYDYSRIPLWILNSKLEILKCFFPEPAHELTNHMSMCIGNLTPKIETPSFDILCCANELYCIFAFERGGETFYMLCGPMLLSAFYHITDMRSFSFAENLSYSELKLLVDNLPVISLTSFECFLRIIMLLFKGKAPAPNEISGYKFSKLQGSLNRTFIHELFENAEEYRLHTPYSQELAVLNCIKEGDLAQLEATYRTLPETKYGNMSDNPLRLFFYGCIANTTLVTRYAIEGGLDEETAFTLSDIYIRQMENSHTLYELNVLNEKMATDFTERVAAAKASNQTAFVRPIARCIAYIEQNLHTKITLDVLSKEVNLTPKYLSCLFKEETGQTLSSFLEEKRIEKAKNLLTYSQYSYGEISDFLSFNSQSYFTAVFKKRTGLTPKEYRDGYFKYRN